MFDNGMLGAVGGVMQADRLAQASRNLRLREAGGDHRLSARKATPVRRQLLAGGAYRTLVAKKLIALATRIAPAVMVPNSVAPAPPA
jgi:hypothetical protein